MKQLIWIAACLLLAGCSRPAAESQLLFEDAWVRAMPPGSMMTAGFGRLVNNSNVDLEITAYTSPQFADVSLHRTVLEDGMSRMKEVPTLMIPAGSEIELAPGGYHLMFMQPIEKQGDVLLLHVDADGGGRFSFELPLERR